VSLKKNKKNVNLVIVAHPDDEILGFGATGAKFVQNGDTVQPVIICGKAEKRTRARTKLDLIKDMKKANQYLGFNDPIIGSFPNLKLNNIDHFKLVSFIEKIILDFKPNRIFTHHPSDLNDDHIFVSKSTLVATKIFQRTNIFDPINSIAYMEILSSTDWSLSRNAHRFTPNYYSSIEDFLIKKIESLSFYEGIMREHPHPRSEKSITALATYRGSQSGSIFAEAFECIYNKF
jgi:LmbE family N-acetylglucosaminyl deacetylase